MSDQVIKIILTGDGTGLEGAANRAASALGKVRTGAGQTGAGLQQLTGNSKQTEQAMRMLAPQITDVVTSIASGQQPLTVLLQQGGQVKDMFGGFVPAFRALASVVTLTSVAISGAAAVVGLLGLAYKSGASDSAALRDSLLLTHNAAGVTGGGFTEMARRVAAAQGATVGAAREIAQGMVSTGRIGGAALEPVISAATRVAQVSGQSADSVVSDFAGMANGVAAWAEEHNKRWHFATADQLEYIRTLEENGNAQKAMIEVSKLVTEQLSTQQQNLGYLEKAWNGIKSAASGAWEAMKGLGRDSSNQEAASAIRARLAEMEAANPAYKANPAWQREREQLEQQLNNLNRLALREQEAASSKAAEAQATEELVALRKQLATVTQDVSGHNAQYTKSIETVEAAARGGLITEAARVSMLTELAKKYGKTNIDQANAGAKTGMEQRLAVIDAMAERYKAATSAISAVLKDAQARDVMSASDAAQALGDLQANELAAQVAYSQQRLAAMTGVHGQEKEVAKERERIETLQLQRDAQLAATARAVAAADLAAAEAAYKRRAATQDGARSLINSLDQSNRDTGISQILDADQRATAETAARIADMVKGAAPLLAQLKQELDLAFDPDVEAALKTQIEQINDALAKSIELANKGLTQQLKPEWQKMIEGWGDTNRVMRDTWDDSITSMLKSGEDLFVKLATAQNVSVKQMVQNVTADLLRGEYRSLVGKDGANLVNVLNGLAGRPTTKGYSGDESSANFMGPVDPASTAQQTAADSLQASGDTLADSGALLSAAAQAFQTPLATLTKLGGSVVQSVLGFVAPQSQLVAAAAALQSAAASLMAGAGGGGSVGGDLLSAVFKAGLGGGGSAGGVDYTVPTPQAGFAKGGAFAAGVALFAAGGAFASGGNQAAIAQAATNPPKLSNSVISNPTRFTFSEGGRQRLGELGEAGPEAIMPLTRSGEGLAVTLVGQDGQTKLLPLTRDANGRLAVRNDLAAQTAAQQAQPSALHARVAAAANDAADVPSARSGVPMAAARGHATEGERRAPAIHVGSSPKRFALGGVFAGEDPAAQPSAGNRTATRRAVEAAAVEPGTPARSWLLGPAAAPGDAAPAVLSAPAGSADQPAGQAPLVQAVAQQLRPQQAAPAAGGRPDAPAPTRRSGDLPNVQRLQRLAADQASAQPAAPTQRRAALQPAPVMERSAQFPLATVEPLQDRPVPAALSATDMQRGALLGQQASQPAQEKARAWQLGQRAGGLGVTSDEAAPDSTTVVHMTNHYSISNPSGDLAALQRLLDQRDAKLRADMTADLMRPGRAGYRAARS